MKNNLEQRMLEAIRKIGPNGMPGAYSEACTKIAIEEIRKAFEHGFYSGCDQPMMKEIMENYLSENNLISKE